LLGEDGARKWKKLLKPNSEKISGNCAELVSTTFSFYGIKSPFRQKSDIPASTKVRAQIKESQRKGLLIGEIITTSKTKEAIKTRRHQKMQQKSPHRKSGVTKKSQFRA